MRLRTFIASALAASLFGLLGFRILDLEQRVAALAAQLAEAAKSERATNPSAGPRASCEQRLDALESRLARMKTRPNGALGASEPADPGGVDVRDEAAILSVVERENSRIRDVQLEFSRSRWLEARDA